MTHTIEYQCGGGAFAGVVCGASAASGSSAASAGARGNGSAKKPVVLICHAWAGQDEFTAQKAALLADLGYIGFAIDVYGAGKRGTTTQECSALMTPLVNDRRLLRDRLVAAADAARTLPGADGTRLAAIGYCFGGLCALDCARANIAGLRGAISFHALFAPPNIGTQAKIEAKVLALHGWDDPMATPEAALGFATEMSAAQADWELDAYGGTKHAFTNPAANDPGLGLQYSAQADQRSWARATAFLAEVLR